LKTALLQSNQIKSGEIQGLKQQLQNCQIYA